VGVVRPLAQAEVVVALHQEVVAHLAAMASEVAAVAVAVRRRSQPSTASDRSRASHAPACGPLLRLGSSSRLHRPSRLDHEGVGR